MSVFIAPAISVATGLLNQGATIRARKLASDIANAQTSNNLADQSYLMVVARSGQTPPTRYEYDQAVAPYMSAIQSGDIATLQRVGLWTDAYIANIARQHPQMGPQMLPTPVALPPAGASAQTPAGEQPQPGALPSWAVPAGLAAVGLLVVSLVMGRRKRS